MYKQKIEVTFFALFITICYTHMHTIRVYNIVSVVLYYSIYIKYWTAFWWEREREWRRYQIHIIQCMLYSTVHTFSISLFISDTIFIFLIFFLYFVLLTFTICLKFNGCCLSSKCMFDNNMVKQLFSSSFLYLYQCVCVSVCICIYKLSLLSFHLIILNIQYDSCLDIFFIIRYNY